MKGRVGPGLLLRAARPAPPSWVPLLGRGVEAERTLEVVGVSWSWREVRGQEARVLGVVLSRLRSVSLGESLASLSLSFLIFLMNNTCYSTDGHLMRTWGPG